MKSLSHSSAPNATTHLLKKFNLKVREEIPQEKLDVFFEVMDKIHEVIQNKNIYSK